MALLSSKVRWMQTVYRASPRLRRSNHQVSPTTRVRFGGQLYARTIMNYLGDVWRSGSLNPENPLIKALDASKAEEYLPYFPFVQAHHVKDAIRHVKDKQAAIQARHELLFVPSVNDKYNKDVDDASIVNDSIRFVNDMEEPAQRLRQLCAMMSHRGANKPGAAELWHTAGASVYSEIRPFQCLQDIRIDHLRSMDSWLKKNRRERDSSLSSSFSAISESIFATRLLLRKCQTLVGVRDIANDKIDGGNATRYREFSERLEDVEANILSKRSTVASPAVLSDVYNYVGIRREQAKLLGYENPIDQFLCQSGVTSLEEIRAIHDEIKREIVPAVRLLTGAKSRAELELETYLGTTAAEEESTISDQQIEAKNDEFHMMRLERHVTLDGALQFVFQLLKQLCGVSFKAVEYSSSSDSDRAIAFGAYDGDSFLGTLIVDPLGGLDQVHHAGLIPVFPKSATTEPLVFLSLSVLPPTWEDDPIKLTWEDCESLFHEMGHCVQILLGKSALGCVHGPEHLSGETSEWLPKFMEHWLTEESTIHAMVVFSQSGEKFSDEDLETAFRVRSRTKMLKLVEQAFRSSMEISLLCDFDLKGKETVVELQARLVDNFIPHADVDDRNLEPLVDTLKSTVFSRGAAAYRYLWSDCASATVFKALKESYESSPESTMEEFRILIRETVLHQGPNADLSHLLKRYRIDSAPSTAALFKVYQIQ